MTEVTATEKLLLRLSASLKMDKTSALTLVEYMTEEEMQRLIAWMMQEHSNGKEVTSRSVLIEAESIMSETGLRVLK